MIRLANKIDFIKPRTMSEVDVSQIPLPAWPWPRSLPDWLLRDLEHRCGPDARFVKAYIGVSPRREPELLSGIGTIECSISYTPQTETTD